MHTKSLIALTLFLVGAPSLTACTIVTASDGDDAGAGGGDDTKDDTTSKGGTSDQNDGGANSDKTDDTANDEDGGASDASDQTTASDDDSDGGDRTAEGDAGEETTNPPEEDGGMDGVFKGGSVSLMQMSLSVGGTEITTATASAGFGITAFDGSNGSPDVDTPCETTTVGKCTLMECEAIGDAGAGQGQSTYTKASAGNVKITGLSADVELVDNSGTYAAVSGTSRWWNGGEKLVASAPGGDEVPKFSLELEAPALITMTSPSVELGEAVSMSRSTDFEVAWEDGEEGDVTLYVIDADDANRSISCTVPADAGGVVIDESLLSDFSDEGALTVTLSSATSKVVDGWTLSFSAGVPVVSAEIAFED